MTTTEMSRMGGHWPADLGDLADAIEHGINCPITIEDPDHRVLAHSARQDEVDQDRIHSIIHRRPPKDTLALDQQSGALERLARAPGSVFIDPLPGRAPDTKARVAVALRYGSELLGSIWAVAHAPLDGVREEYLREAARVVARQLHVRREVEREVQRREKRVTGTVVGHSELPPATVQTMQLLAIGGADHATRTAIARAIDRRARSGDPMRWAERSGTLIGTQQRAAPDTVDVRRMVHAAVREGDPATQCVIVLGSAETGGDAPGLECRLLELRMRAALHAGHRGIVDGEVRMLDLVSALLADGIETYRLQPNGAYGRLLEIDRSKHSELVRSVAVWLHHNGDVQLAAQELFVHPNTLRYRLQRARLLADVDLDDRDERLEFAVQHSMFAGA